MKHCQICGSPANDNDSACPSCGAPFPRNDQTNMPVQGNYQPYGAAPQPKATSIKEFLKLSENKKMRRELNSCAIICYVCAGITLILGLFVLQNPYSLIDVALLIGLGLGIHLARSRVCAVTLCAYAAVNMIITFIESGRFGGYLILIAGIYSIVYTFKLNKLWTQYQQQ